MVTRRDYTAEAVEAAKSVLVELVHLLGEYRDDIVLIGGWVPELLLPQEPKPHVGSIDIDLALDHRKIHDEGYKLIEELLKSRGYYPGKQPFIFLRDVPIGDRVTLPASRRGASLAQIKINLRRRLLFISMVPYVLFDHHGG